MPDNLPEHGAGAQPSHDPQEAKRWTGTVTVTATVEIGPDDGCSCDEDAEEFARDNEDAWALFDYDPHFEAWA